MHTTRLRKVGRSTTLAIPPALLDLLRLGPGARVGLTVADGRLVVEPQGRPRYTLDELLVQCDSEAAGSGDDREWLSRSSNCQVT